MPKQLALPLSLRSAGIDGVELPESLLRAAWESSRLKIGFEEAMALTYFRIGLRHMAMIMALKRRMYR